jgi:hypothetical protein
MKRDLHDLHSQAVDKYVYIGSFSIILSECRALDIWSIAD